MGKTLYHSVVIQAKRRARVALVAILILVVTAGGTASALTINLTYDPDSTFTAAGLSAADIVNMKAANTYAVSQFTSNFNDNINVNIRVTAVPGTGTLGQSSTFLVSTSFANLRAKTIADATTADDATATGPGGSVPTVDPVVGSHNYFVSRAQAKALAITADDLSEDGTYTFGGGFSYTYDPQNRAVAGKVDYIGVSMHEFSEIMGRIGIMGEDIGVGSPSYMQMDLFHYTGANTRGLNNGAGRSFSINNGTTLLKGFNNAAVNGGDLADWASGTNDSFNAFSSSGVQNDLTPVDLRAMDVIGYNLVTGVPVQPDFNSDGNADYVLHNSNTGQSALWYLNNNQFNGSDYGPRLPPGWTLVDAADFSGDGKPDYVLFRPATRQTAIWYMSGAAYSSGVNGPTIANGYELVAVADFNSDGHPDYVLYNPSTHRTAIWYLNNNVYTSGDYGPTLVAGYTLAGLADVDGNGTPDYLLFNPSTHQTAIWYMSGSVRTGAAYGPNIVAGWALVGTSDFNRDGHPDYLLYNASTRQTAIWYLNGNVRTGTNYGPTLAAGYVLAAP